MIRTASLFHDDVIDGAVTRRGVPEVHVTFGNKVAILAGDYLLTRPMMVLLVARVMAQAEADTEASEERTETNANSHDSDSGDVPPNPGSVLIFPWPKDVSPRYTI